VQFQVGPDADDLIRTVGETSKMRLMWGTMGYSATYALFTAVGETIGAALVLWRRTTTIGALVIAVIMINVCFLDIAHHVGGVAEASLMYMAQALVLVGPDAKRLYSLYVSNEPVAPAWEEPRLFEWRWMWVIKAFVVIGVFLRPMFIFEMKIGKYWIKRPQPAVVGNYKVAQFIRQNDTVPAFLGDSTRWDAVFISVKDSAKGSITILRMDGTSSNLGLELDSIQHRITVNDQPYSPIPIRKSAKDKKKSAATAKDTAKGTSAKDTATPASAKDTARAASAKDTVKPTASLDTAKGKKPPAAKAKDPKAIPEPPPPKKIGLLEYIVETNGDVRLTGKINNINYDVKLTRIVNERTPLWRGTRPFAVPR
jgi:hypothetical protein